MRNNVNRIVNCETANLSKTVNAAVRQIENIKYIQQKSRIRSHSTKFKRDSSFKNRV
ncbi:DNA-binding protein WhiA [Paraclostridium bifermentans]|nr:DNA-binding protein WhiA [Paraclostridium bifermentans]